MLSRTELYNDILFKRFGNTDGGAFVFVLEVYILIISALVPYNAFPFWIANSSPNVLLTF